MTPKPLSHKTLALAYPRRRMRQRAYGSAAAARSAPALLRKAFAAPGVRLSPHRAAKAYPHMALGLAFARPRPTGRVTRSLALTCHTPLSRPIGRSGER